GQVNSRVWNTDIETAIDGIEIGGRNLIPNSTDYSMISGYSGAQVDREDGVTVSEWGASDAARYRVSGGSSVIKLRRPLITNTTEMSGVTYTWSIYAKNNGGTSVRFDTNRIGSYTLEPEESKRIIITGGNTSGSSMQIQIRTLDVADDMDITIWRPKLEKGNKATDWTPAPEDTDAKIDHIETEWTQTFDSFSQTVSSIDGRVTAQKQTIDSITQTVTDQTGKIATVEQNLNGIQQTVSDPVNGLVTQVSTLASGFNVLVKDFEDLEVGGRNLIVSSGVTPNSYVGSDGSLSSGAGYFLTDFIEVKANEFYTISMLLQGNGYSRIAYYDL